MDGHRGDDHQAETPAIAASNKRKLDVSKGDGGGDEQQQSNNNNKRQRQRKNKKKGKGKQQAQNNKHNQPRTNKKQFKRGNNNNNWIENCSNSFNRIPSNSAAPLTCVVTRVEIEEEPLLPKGVVGGSVGDGDGDGDGKIVPPADCDGDGELNKDDDAQTSSSTQNGQQLADTSYVGASEATPANAEETAPLKIKISNIARPSLNFLSQYTKEKNPWKMQQIIEENDEEKKLFIPVKRCPSANGPTKWAQNRKKNKGKQSNSNYVHLPGGDNGDGITNPYPTSLVPDKFWAQRKRLFSRYDEGIQIGGKDDPEMWYSVTPESIANHVAERMVGMIRQKQHRPKNDEIDGNHACKESIVVIDVFCGCGGNSIAFARLSHLERPEGSRNTPRVKVVAVDNSLSRLKMAAHNAAIYGLGKEDIIFVHADAIEVLNYYIEGTTRQRSEGKSGEDATTKEKSGAVYDMSAGFELGGISLLPDNVDGIFLSPPWGGMDYENEKGKPGFDIVKSITVESSPEEAHHDNDVGNQENGEVSVKTNGGELLSITAKAVFDDSKQDGVIAYFVPRNTNGISLGQCAVTAGINGCFEMEQNVVNGKVKTVTAYFGHNITF